MLLMLCITASVLSRTTSTDNDASIGSVDEAEDVYQNYSASDRVTIHTYLQLLRIRSKYKHVDS